MSPQFIRDRKRGRAAQDYVANTFKAWGLQVSNVKDGYFPGWDLVVSGNLHGNHLNFKAEVKYDIKAQETNNLYLDIEALKHSKASILCICINNPIDTVLMLPLQDALNYAVKHCNAQGGEFQEKSAIIPIEQFISDLKPKILTTKNHG